ncbi:hypothetical protein NQ015_10825 [Corynebacterium sp. 153RC1]|uniref:LGFP repeat-containing protein n=1 Tax=unclassified Corynebacterium TaxID=2624378 RepID=UPI00211C6CEF|nr:MULTISPECIES: hypothetical protein [unclassified Corynebacterium]MCQ9353502.1 hypothetical protein [Corynebacterium sp. 209RC1]MCQ9355730.1 hypothetical protein [Corynebacterium sp. 1222RC1]MCQ9357902.1 hypothetical protein [Corynebacterium sp. 122RC1]MCQ9360098.1 hypothetical protein [Corynebacterium sp. 142RC1]MCQ9362239.1 hypothetical protein [Corynebacterium sp. 153RC1]
MPRNKTQGSSFAFGSLGVPAAQADVFHGFWIGGKIEETYHRLGGWGRFGDATTPESVSALNGRFQVFVRDSSIYWHPNVDGGTAHQVGGRIRDKWADLGWENAALGYPVTDELTTPDGIGRFNHFQGGSIYWSPETDAHQIWGEIRDKWAAQGWETGPLGYPVTDELTTPDGNGWFNHFENGSIYYSPASGVHTVSGKIRDYWGKAGWEKSRFSFPSSDAYAAAGGTKQDFIGGSIQSFEPTGVALPEYDNKQYSSYRQVYPLFAKEDKPRWHAAGAHRELIQHMDTYFPLTGCPKELTTGTTCTFTGMGARSGKVTVERISDTGFTLKTAAGHPEGANRLLNIRFDEVTAPPAGEKNVVFDSPDVKAQYTGSNKTWIRLVVESFGPTQTTQVQGPFSSEHVANEVWALFATTLRSTLDESTTSYVPLSR